MFENNYFTKRCSGSEAGWLPRPIDFVYHSTLGLRVITKKKKGEGCGGYPQAPTCQGSRDAVTPVQSLVFGVQALRCQVRAHRRART